MRPFSYALCFFILVLCSCWGCVTYSGVAEEASFTSSDGITLRGSLVFPQKERQALDEELARWSKRQGSILPDDIPVTDDDYLRKIGYDPAPFLQQLTTPMLYLYGSKDINVPTTQCVAVLTRLAAAGKPFAYPVYEGARHELGSISIVPPFYQFEDGYADLLGDFATAHVTLDRVAQTID